MNAFRSDVIDRQTMMPKGTKFYSKKITEKGHKLSFDNIDIYKMARGMTEIYQNIDVQDKI